MTETNKTKTTVEVDPFEAEIQRMEEIIQRANRNKVKLGLIMEALSDKARSYIKSISTNYYGPSVVIETNQQDCPELRRELVKLAHDGKAKKTPAYDGQSLNIEVETEKGFAGETRKPFSWERNADGEPLDPDEKVLRASIITLQGQLPASCTVKKVIHVIPKKIIEEHEEERFEVVCEGNGENGDEKQEQQ